MANNDVVYKNQYIWNRMKAGKNKRYHLDKETIETIKAREIDYTDTPKIEGTESNPYRPAHPEILDKLPPDIVQELARRRLEELKAAGYKVTEKL